VRGGTTSATAFVTKYPTPARAAIATIKPRIDIFLFNSRRDDNDVTMTETRLVCCGMMVFLIGVAKLVPQAPVLSPLTVPRVKSKADLNRDFPKLPDCWQALTAGFDHQTQIFLEVEKCLKILSIHCRLCVLIYVQKRGLGPVLVTFLATQNLVSIVVCQFQRVKARFA
jgi:hypothetical protein